MIIREEGGVQLEFIGSSTLNTASSRYLVDSLNLLLRLGTDVTANECILASHPRLASHFGATERFFPSGATNGQKRPEGAVQTSGHFQDRETREGRAEN